MNNINTYEYTHRLDMLRGIMCLVILNCHFINLFNGLDVSLKKYLTFFSDTRLALDYFFILSGFVVVYSTMKNGGGGLSVVGYFVKRFFRLFPVVFISIFLGYLIMTFGLIRSPMLKCIQEQSLWTLHMFNFESSFQLFVRDLVTSMFCGFSLYNVNLWTISFELYVPTLIYVTLKFKDIFKLDKSSFFILLMLCLVLSASKNALFVNISYVLCFFIGGELAKNNIIDNLNNFKPNLLLSAFLVLFLISHLVGGRFQGPCTLLEVIILFALVLSNKKLLIDSHIISCVLSKIGSCSYEIYAYHLCIFVSFASWIVLVLPFNFDTNICISYLSSLFIIYLVSSYSSKVNKYIYPYLNNKIKNQHQ